MKENQFKIMTLSLIKIIDSIYNSEEPSTPPYKFDLYNRITYDTIVSKVEIYPDTAFFHQALLASGSEFSEDALLKKVLFLDCKGVFYGETADKEGSESNPKKQAVLRIVKHIFVEGILIKHEENDKEYCRYLPFDKSNSMAREARITFVESIGDDTPDEFSFRKELDKRICLGIDFTKIADKVITSKFYAYRGLMLTTAKRVDLCTLFGKEKPSDDKQRRSMAKTLASSIIVIDVKKYNFDISAVTAEETSPNVWKRQIKTIEEDPDRYDGGGLISKEASASINSLFRKNYLFDKVRSTISLILQELRLEKADIERIVDGIDESVILPFCDKHVDLSELRSVVAETINKITKKDNNALLDIEPYNSYLSDLLDHINESKLSSYQIRLPFGKGMLHEVDYHSFFKEELGISDDAQIIDVYDLPRKISDTKIILTRSMFKCTDWLKKYRNDRDKIEYENDSGESIVFEDPMEFYFYQCLSYDHALYIGNTNAMLHNDGTVKLNYQFLSTLNLTNEDIKSLANNQFDTVPKIAKKKMLFDIDAPENDSSDSVSLDKKGAAWARAYALCTTEQEKNNLLRDSKVKGMLRGTIESLERDVAIGRILVEGECRFLSRDLLSFLLDASLLVEGIDDKVKKQILSIRNDTTIRTNHYYMPRMKSKIARDGCSAILRNPHLSRNEETIAKRGYDISQKEYYKVYFSHLSGIVMVPYDSHIPMAIGGADFDGDLVKIVHDPIIVDAIKQGVYDDELKRSLHVIHIPNVTGGSRMLSACLSSDGGTAANGYPIDFDTIQNTFNSRVGQISNMAVRFAKRDSKNALKSIDNQGNTDSAECTIITGLEIDAAKNGRRPSFDSIQERLDELNRNDPNEIDGKDYFVSFKEQFSKLPSFNKKWKKEKTSNGDWQIISGQKKTFLAKKTEGDASFAPIDSLPWLYFENMENKKPSLVSKEENIPGRIYKFDSFDDALFKDKETALIKIIQAYSHVRRQASIDHQNAIIAKNAKYGDKIRNILRLQYDSLDSRFSESDLNEDSGKQTILEVFNNTYRAMRDYFFSKKQKGNQDIAINDIDEVIAKMRASHWEIMYGASKEQFITEHGFLKSQDDVTSQDERIKMLTNFSCGGYKILYFILKSIKCELQSPDFQGEDDGDPEEFENDSNAERDQQQPEEILSDGRDVDVKTNDNQYVRGYMNIYREAMRKKESSKDWKNSLTERCKTDIATLFGDEKVNWNYVIKIAYGQRKKNAADPKGEFFWDIIPPKTIAENINRGTEYSTNEKEV